MAAFARMTAYLESLPLGLDSYPDYVQKASVYREFIAQMPSGGMMGLPATLAHMLIDPLPVNAWVPEVHANALYLAIADVHLPDEGDFLARKLDANRKMLRSPLYRFLMAVMSPEGLLKKSGDRWGKFHRGIKLAVKELGRGQVDLRMSFPRHLVPVLMVRTYGLVFQAIAEAAGGTAVRVVVQAHDDTSALYHASWQ